MNDLLVKYCKELRFSGNIIENAKLLKSEDNLEFLTELFRLELQNREIKRKNAYIKSAKFDILKTFEYYTFEDISIPNSIDIEDILNSKFVSNKENLILYVNVGSGKTHLAIAAGIAACNHGKKVRFFRTSSLVNQLAETIQQGCIVKVMKTLDKCDLIICDEWGYIPLDSTGTKLLFQVIAECYERKSLIITTNLEFTLWNEILGDAKITATIIDRIIHHIHLLDFSNRDSRRLINSIIKLI